MNKLTLFAVLVCSALVSCRSTSRGQLGQADGGLALTSPRDNTLRQLAPPVNDRALVVEEDAGEERPGSATDELYALAGRRLLAKMPKVSSKLREALSLQRDLLLRQDPNHVYYVANRELTTKDFLQVIDRLLHDSTGTFVPEAVPVAREGEVKFTAYFSPDLPASRVRTKRFAYPLLSAPADDSLRRRTRAQLTAAYADSSDAHVLAWVSHPLDVYLMQLQGSGYVTYRDGQREYLGFDRSNGHAFTPAARALASSDFDVSYRDIRRIRAWMAENLGERARVIEACENYVYFRRSDTAPMGAGSVELSPMISVAADPAHYPLGAVLLAEVPSPRKSGVRETRILLVQDVGAAIKGKGRLDLYTGIGRPALDVARLTSHVGEVYMLAPQRSVEDLLASVSTRSLAARSGVL